MDSTVLLHRGGPETVSGDGERATRKLFKNSSLVWMNTGKQKSTELFVVWQNYKTGQEGTVKENPNIKQAADN